MSGMISSGMGRNSVAMIIMMFKRGQIMPIVFADTGAEMPETYEYIEYFDRWLDKKYGQKIIQLSAKRTPELYTDDTREDLVSYYTRKKSIPLIIWKGCTDKFKLQPLKKWQKRNNIEGEWYRGIDAGEAHRAKGQDLSYFPLIQEGIDLEGCKQIIKEEGLKAPVKSGCYMCPNQGRKGFWKLKRTHPDLFKRAMFMENAMILRRRSEGKNFETLIPSGPALADIDKQGEMFADCDFSEITPCMCTL